MIVTGKGMNALLSESGLPQKPPKEVGVDLKRFVFAQTYHRIYPRFLEERRAAPMHARVGVDDGYNTCLLYTSPSPRDQRGSRMPSSA